MEYGISAISSLASTQRSSTSRRATPVIQVINGDSQGLARYWVMISSLPGRNLRERERSWKRQDEHGLGIIIRDLTETFTATGYSKD
ncbi:unnamed protein product [Dovyalis caffra]|uniref:Uncharacterized protein n=1 Tax=Dovyalis caffra TaxID=77055 RepID=A0AAV1R3E6_9ROSI|nr:unnamed protein product [Dovyalis caffra]